MGLSTSGKLCTTPIGFADANGLLRGAAESKGKTSWQAKAEQKDYMSMIGFMIFYMHQLSPVSDQPEFARTAPQLHDLSPIHSQVPGAPKAAAGLRKLSFLTDPFGTQTTGSANTNPRLLLAGYSYGALITSLIPPIISSFVSPFQTPVLGTAYAEIRLRAECLAKQQTELIDNQITTLLETSTHHRARSTNADDALRSPRSRKSSGVRMGGGEDLRRSSHDSFRSRSIDAPEMVKKSVDRVRSIGKHKRMAPVRANTHDSVTSLVHNSRPGTPHSSKQSLQDDSQAKLDEEAAIKAIPGVLIGLQTGYMLVSPLQGVVHNLATMWTSKCMDGKDSISENEMKFTIDPTLALFGDDDIFVSVKRLRAWAEKVSNVAKDRGDGLFWHKEITGAGHFWHDQKAVKELQEEIKDFVRTL